MPFRSPNPALSAPLDELLAVIFRQFRRPLAAQGLVFTDAQLGIIAAQIVAQTPLDQDAKLILDGLISIVTESEQVLSQWNLTFEQSLITKMDDIAGWETTAEFIEIANNKSNAELRISNGAALVAALGDLRYAGYLLFLATQHEQDLDTILARRVLFFISGVSPDAPDWLTQVRTWLRNK